MTDTTPPAAEIVALHQPQAGAATPSLADPRDEQITALLALLATQVDIGRRLETLNRSLFASYRAMRCAGRGT